MIAPPQPIARRIAITSPVARNSSSLGCFFPPSSSPSELVISPLNESLCARLKSHLHPSLLIISRPRLVVIFSLSSRYETARSQKSSHAFQPVIIFLIIHCFYKLVVNLFCLCRALHSFRRVFKGTDVVEYKRSQNIQQRNINPKTFSLSTEPPFFYFYLKIGLTKNFDILHDALYKQGEFAQNVKLFQPVILKHHFLTIFSVSQNYSP